MQLIKLQEQIYLRIILSLLLTTFLFLFYMLTSHTKHCQRKSGFWYSFSQKQQMGNVDGCQFFVFSTKCVFSENAKYENEQKDMMTTEGTVIQQRFGS